MAKHYISPAYPKSTMHAQRLLSHAWITIVVSFMHNCQTERLKSHRHPFTASLGLPLDLTTCTYISEASPETCTQVCAGV
jgi:hypothetical protein